MADPQTYGIRRNPYYLDSGTALGNIRNNGLQSMPALDFGNPTSAVEAPSPDVNTTTPRVDLRGMAIPDRQQDQSPLQPMRMILHTYGGSDNSPTEPPVEQTPLQAMPPIFNKQEEGAPTGIAKALYGGIKDTATSLFSSGATLLGANDSVVDASKFAQEGQKTEAQALSAFKQDIGRRIQKDDDSLWSGIKNVSAATAANPEGAFQMLVSQLPNTAVSLGAGYYGAVGGAAVGSVVPVIGTAIGGIAGFLTGLYAANTALEIGGKSLEKARDNVFTDQERSESIKEGATKGAVITAVDAVTLGASKWLLGTANRAVETATVKAIEGSGIDATKAVTSIKEAQRSAVQATAGQGVEATTAAVEKATLETMARQGLTNPNVMESVRKAQKTAMESVNTIGNKVMRGTAAVGLETAGEGLGEYLGELAATGKASPTEAVLEALSGLSMSIGELNAVAKIEKPGDLTAATNITPPELKGKGTGITGVPIVDTLNEQVTALDDFKAVSTADYFDKAMKRDRDSTLNVMAALYHQEKVADPSGTTETNPMLKTLSDAMTRLSVSDEVMSRTGMINPEKPSQSVLKGEQILSDYPQFRETFVQNLEGLAGTIPANATPKKENRTSATPDFKPLSEEDVMNAPIPDDNQETGKVVNPELVAKLDTVKNAENPGVTSAQFIKESLSKVNSEALQNWDQSSPDKYGVTSYASPDNQQEVFTHPKFPGYVFDKKDDLFNAFELNKQATQALRDKIALKANPKLDTQETNEMDLLDEPTDQQASSGTNKVDIAKENLDDALFNLWDVASDASNTKMNIMGKRYTAKDLPKAIQQVMEALVKLGYVKLADISEKLLERMKASENWKSLVDKVTPEMLRKAYDNLGSFEGKETAEELNKQQPSGFDVAPSKKKRSVTDLIKVLPAVIKQLIEEGGSSQFKDMRDLTILLKKRMDAKEDWSSLSNKLTEPIVRQAYQNATNEIASTSDNERKGTFVKDRVITKEELKDIQGKKNKEAIAERDRVNKANKAMEEKRQTTPVNDLKVRDLETQIKNIYKQYTQSSFLQDAVNTVLRRISDIEATLLKMGSFAEFGKSGELNIYKRISDGQVGMEQQILNDGRMSGASDYYNKEDEAVFENPDTRAALLAKKRILEKELELAMRDKVSKQAYLGRIGLREIRRQIDDAIQQAVRNGLPIEDTIELGRQWLGGIDNYFNLSSIQKAERKAENKEAAKEIEQYFEDLKNTNVEEVTLPSDVEFANGIHKDLVSRKITTDEAVKLVDQAAERGELESKKKTVTALLSQLVSDFGIMKDTSAADKALANITNWASKLKKEGLLRYDDLVDIFHSNNVDTPHAVVKMSEVAASRGLLDFMAENKHDSTFRYYWLRSMDRVVNFNPDTLNSYQFTDLERDLYAEYKKQIGSINNRRKNAYEKQEYGDLLFNRYTVDQMRNPENLPLNERMRLQQMYPNLVDAYFGDIWFANRNGYGRDAADKLNEQDRGQFQEWLDRKNRIDDDSAARLERQQYFAALSQFRHISDEDYTNLYKMMSRDSIANLPMILDMARELNNDVLESDKRGEINTTPQKPRVPMTQADVEELNNDAFEQDVMSAFVSAQMGVKGVASSSLGRDPLFDFNTYKDVVEGRLVSYEESSGEQNAQSMEDESVAEQMMYGMDVDMQDLTSDKNDANFGDQVDDETRLRQGQYTGILSTGLVMNYVSKLTKTWKNAPNIVVLQSHLQLPEGIREEVAAKLQNGMGAKGLFDGSTGTVYLFSNFLDNEADVQFTLFHEAYGHLGLRLMFGQEFDTFLNNMYESSPAVRGDVDARMRQGGIGKLEAIEETLSDYAGQNKEVGAVKQFIGKIIEMLRKIGLNKVANFIGEFSDAELAVSLKAAREYAENAGGVSPLNGGPKDIRLSEDRPPYELFAKKGVNTVGYARYDPLVGQYYLFTATKGDIRTGSTMTSVDSLDDVIAALGLLGTVERRKRSGFFRDNKVPADFVKFLNSQQLGYFAKKWETFLRRTQNQYLPVFRLVEQMEQLGRVSGNLDLRKFLRTNERQTAEQASDFNREYVTPIMDLLAQAEKAGGKFMPQLQATNIYEMLNKFLLAQHADERNKQVNKRFPDGKDYDGSGMASASSVKADPVKHPVDVAQQVMDFVATQPYAKEFEKIGLLLDRLGDVKVDREVEAGLLTSDYYTARGEFVAGEGTLRKAAYRNYRNLGGVNNDLDEDYTNDPSLVIGHKFNVKGKDKAALGRADEAPDILARTLLAAEASIIRSNKNKVAQRILAFFETNYDPNFVSINEQSFKRQIDNNGFVNLVENTSYYNQPDVFVAKVRGIPVTIRFKDAGYNSITEAIHGKSDPQSDHPVRHVFQVLGRFTGSLITKYNPYWIPVNFVRDVQTLFFNASANGQIGVGMAGKMMKALLPAMGTAIRIALMDMQVTTTAGKMAKASMLKLMDSKAGSTVAVAAGAAGIAAILPGIGIAAGAGVGALIGMFASNSKASQQRMAMYEEGRKAGAFTSFINHKDLESQVIAINEAIHGKSAISQIHGMLKFWELVTIPVEMAPRLAAYAVMRSEGASQIDAADYAGGVTVDFNMRGADEWLRAAYLFFNPAVQGTAQLLKLMKDNPRRVATVAGGLWMLGFMTSALVRMKGGDDEDEKEKRRRERGLSILDEIPDYKRATSLIIAPGKHGGAIPIAYGWNAPFALGVFMADSVVGNVPWSVTAKRSMTATFEAFSPVGGNGFDMTKIFSDPAGQAVALIAPTALAPIAQWMTNTNRFGGPLYPSGQFGSGGGSDTKKAFQSVNPISQWMADTLQEATGGERRNKLGIDLNPALIDHLSQAYFPGLISEMYKGAGMLVRKEKGLDTPKDKEPFWDRFSANPAESFDAAAFRRIDNAISDISKELKDTPRTSPRFQQIMAAHPQFGRAELALKETNRDLDKLRSELNAAESTAYMYRKEGKIEEANKMDKSNVEFRNQTRKAEQILFERMVTAASKSGFKAEIYSD